MITSPVRKREASEPEPDQAHGPVLTTDLTWNRLVKGYIAFGPDIPRLVKWTGLTRDQVKENIELEKFQKYAAQCRLNPKSVTPQRAEIICMLTVEAREADSSRDRQSALKMLLELTDDSRPVG